MSAVFDSSVVDDGGNRILDPLPGLDDFYDYRGRHGMNEDAPPAWLPYGQGDVFEDVVVAGCSHEPVKAEPAPLAMIFLHPCTMRRGVRLIDRVTLVQVRWMAKRVKGGDDWRQRDYSMMPLPDLRAEGKSTYCGDFLRIGTVSREELDRDKRIATLSALGRRLFQQRVIHHLTRLVVPLGDLAKATRGVEREITLQAAWVETVCDSYDSQSMEIVEKAEDEFDTYMSQDGRRLALADDARTHQIIAEVYQEMRSRYH